MTTPDGHDLVRQLTSGDPADAAAILARATTSHEPLVLTAAALLRPADPQLLRRAAAVAHRPRDRQVVALAEAHLAGERDRLTALTREHLLDHPDSPVAAWIAAGGCSHDIERTTCANARVGTRRTTRSGATDVAGTHTPSTPTHPATGATPAHPSQETS